MNVSIHHGLCFVGLLGTACAQGAGGGGGDAGPSQGGGSPSTGSTGGGDTTSVGGGGPADCSGAETVGPERADVVIAVDGVTVSTVAGSGASGSSNGAGAAAHFANPVNVLIASADTMYVADFDNGLVRRVTFGGMVSTITDQATFARPFGMVLTAEGDLLVQTDYDETGSEAGITGSALWTIDADDGWATPLLTDVGRPRGLALLPGGGVALSDVFRDDVRTLDVGSGVIADLAGRPGCPGYVDGTGEEAQFNQPYGVAVTGSGDVLVADQMNHTIRRVTAEGVVSTFAGDGVAGMIDGPREQARFDRPQAVAIDDDGNVYVSDLGNHRVRVIGIDGGVRTLAGDGVPGFANGPGATSRFYGMEGLTVTADGKTIFLADGTGGEAPPPFHRVRRISLP